MQKCARCNRTLTGNLCSYCAAQPPSLVYDFHGQQVTVGAELHIDYLPDGDHQHTLARVQRIFRHPQHDYLTFVELFVIDYPEPPRQPPEIIERSATYIRAQARIIGEWYWGHHLYSNPTTFANHYETGQLALIFTPLNDDFPVHRSTDWPADAS